MTGRPQWMPTNSFGKIGREEEEVELHLKEKFECMEVSYGVHKHLWIKIGGIITKGDLMVGVCYQPPNQDDEADETLLRLLKEVLGQQNLVLMGDLNYPDICWEKNTAVHKLSIRFLECIEDCFLLQMLDMPTRNSALIVLLLTN